MAERDAAGLLKLIWENWQSVFRGTLGQAERSLVSELRDRRNRWAHQESTSRDDAYRMLDSADRLLAAISRPVDQQAVEIVPCVCLFTRPHPKTISPFPAQEALYYAREPTQDADRATLASISTRLPVSLSQQPSAIRTK